MAARVLLNGNLGMHHHGKPSSNLSDEEAQSGSATGFSDPEPDEMLRTRPGKRKNNAYDPVTSILDKIDAELSSLTRSQGSSSTATDSTVVRRPTSHTSHTSTDGSRMENGDGLSLSQLGSTHKPTFTPLSSGSRRSASTDRDTGIGTGTNSYRDDRSIDPGLRDLEPGDDYKDGKRRAGSPDLAYMNGHMGQSDDDKSQRERQTGSPLAAKQVDEKFREIMQKRKERNGYLARASADEDTQTIRTEDFQDQFQNTLVYSSDEERLRTLDEDFTSDGGWDTDTLQQKLATLTRTPLPTLRVTPPTPTVTEQDGGGSPRPLRPKRKLFPAVEARPRKANGNGPPPVYPKPTHTSTLPRPSTRSAIKLTPGPGGHTSDADSVRTEDFENSFKDLMCTGNQTESDLDPGVTSDPIHTKVKQLLKATAKYAEKPALPAQSATISILKSRLRSYQCQDKPKVDNKSKPHVRISPQPPLYQQDKGEDSDDTICSDKEDRVTSPRRWRGGGTSQWKSARHGQYGASFDQSFNSSWSPYRRSSYTQQVSTSLDDSLSKSSLSLSQSSLSSSDKERDTHHAPKDNHLQYKHVHDNIYKSHNENKANKWKILRQASQISSESSEAFEHSNRNSRSTSSSSSLFEDIDPVTLQELNKRYNDATTFKDFQYTNVPGATRRKSITDSTISTPYSIKGHEVNMSGTKQKKKWDLIVQDDEEEEIPFAKYTFNKKESAKRKNEDSSSSISTTSTGRSSSRDSIYSIGMMNQYTHLQNGKHVFNKSSSSSLMSDIAPSCTENTASMDESATGYDDYVFDWKNQHSQFQNQNSASNLYSKPFLERPAPYGMYNFPPAPMPSLPNSEQMLTNLGFGDMQTFLPERFLRSWVDKMVVSQVSQEEEYMRRMSQNYPVPPVFYRDQYIDDNDLPPSVSQQQSGRSTPRWKQSFDTSGPVAKNKTGQRKFLRRAHTYNNQMKNAFSDPENLGSTNEESDYSKVGSLPLQKENSFDKLKKILNSKSLVQYKDRDNRRSMFGTNRQQSLPLFLETLSEEEDEKRRSRSPSIEKVNGKYVASKMKSFLEEEERNSCRTSSTEDLTPSDSSRRSSYCDPNISDILQSVKQSLSAIQSENSSVSDGQNDDNHILAAKQYSIPSIVVSEKESYDFYTNEQNDNEMFEERTMRLNENLVSSRPTSPHPELHFKSANQTKKDQSGSSKSPGSPSRHQTLAQTRDNVKDINFTTVSKSSEKYQNKSQSKVPSVLINKKQDSRSLSPKLVTNGNHSNSHTHETNQYQRSRPNSPSLDDQRKLFARPSSPKINKPILNVISLSENRHADSTEHPSKDSLEIAEIMSPVEKKHKSELTKIDSVSSPTSDLYKFSPIQRSKVKSSVSNRFLGNTLDVVEYLSPTPSTASPNIMSPITVIEIGKLDNQNDSLEFEETKGGDSCGTSSGEKQASSYQDKCSRNNKKSSPRRKRSSLSETPKVLSLERRSYEHSPKDEDMSSPDLDASYSRGERKTVSVQAEVENLSPLINPSEISRTLDILFSRLPHYNITSLFYLAKDKNIQCDLLMDEKMKKTSLDPNEKEGNQTNSCANPQAGIKNVESSTIDNSEQLDRHSVEVDVDIPVIVHHGSKNHDPIEETTQTQFENAFMKKFNEYLGHNQSKPQSSEKLETNLITGDKEITTMHQIPVIENIERKLNHSINTIHMKREQNYPSALHEEHLKDNIKLEQSYTIASQNNQNNNITEIGSNDKKLYDKQEGNIKDQSNNKTSESKKALSLVHQLEDIHLKEMNHTKNDNYTKQIKVESDNVAETRAKSNQFITTHISQKQESVTSTKEIKLCDSWTKQSHCDRNKSMFRSEAFVTLQHRSSEEKSFDKSKIVSSNIGKELKTVIPTELCLEKSKNGFSISNHVDIQTREKDDIGKVPTDILVVEHKSNNTEEMKNVITIGEKRNSLSPFQSPNLVPKINTHSSPNLEIRRFDYEQFEKSDLKVLEIFTPGMESRKPETNNNINECIQTDTVEITYHQTNVNDAPFSDDQESADHSKEKEKSLQNQRDVLCKSVEYIRNKTQVKPNNNEREKPKIVSPRNGKPFVISSHRSELEFIFGNCNNKKKGKSENKKDINSRNDINAGIQNQPNKKATSTNANEKSFRICNEEKTSPIKGIPTLNSEHELSMVEKSNTNENNEDKKQKKKFEISFKQNIPDILEQTNTLMQEMNITKQTDQNTYHFQPIESISVRENNLRIENREVNTFKKTGANILNTTPYANVSKLNYKATEINEQINEASKDVNNTTARNSYLRMTNGDNTLETKDEFLTTNQDNQVRFSNSVHFIPHSSENSFMLISESSQSESVWSTSSGSSEQEQDEIEKQITEKLYKSYNESSTEEVHKPKTGYTTTTVYSYKDRVSQLRNSTKTESDDSSSTGISRSLDFDSLGSRKHILSRCQNTTFSKSFDTSSSFYVDDENGPQSSSEGDINSSTSMENVEIQRTDSKDYFSNQNISNALINALESDMFVDHELETEAVNKMVRDGNEEDLDGFVSDFEHDGDNVQYQLGFKCNDENDDVQMYGRVKVIKTNDESDINEDNESTVETEAQSLVLDGVNETGSVFDMFQQVDEEHVVVTNDNNDKTGETLNEIERLYKMSVDDDYIFGEENVTASAYSTFELNDREGNICMEDKFSELLRELDNEMEVMESYNETAEGKYEIHVCKNCGHTMKLLTANNFSSTIHHDYCVECSPKNLTIEMLEKRRLQHSIEKQKH